MGNFKKILCFLLTVVILCTGSLSSLAGYIDENNVTGGEDYDFGQWDGTTDEKSAWTFKNQSLWKISIYVAKNSETHYNDSSASLTDDFYKFGYTFWTYGKGSGIDTTESGGISSLDYLLVETNNKEEYAHQNAPFTELKYSSIKNRFFCGDDNGLIGEENTLPLINNYGGSAAKVADFFNKNMVALRAFIGMAAKAGNITDIDSWLTSKTFTINGETKSGWNLNMIDARKGTTQHTSQVAWVVLYEPVFIINNLNNSGYYHALTPTGIAKSTLEGKYRFTSVHTSNSGFYKLFDGAAVPTGTPKQFGLGLDHSAVAMPNSIYLANSWFGFLNGSTHKTLTIDGVTRYWSLPQQLSGAGVGLRYTRADDFNPKVTIQKTLNGSSSGTLSGFKFTLKNNSTGDSYTLTTDAAGRIVLYVPVGTYTLTESPRSGYTTAEAKTVKVTDTGVTVTVDNKSVHTVTVNYIDKYTNKTIKTAYTTTGNSGTSYNMSSQKLSSITANGHTYTYKSAAGDALSGTLNGDKVINLYYGYNNTITINYRDYYDESKIRDSVTVTQEHNSNYDVTDKKLASISANGNAYNFFKASGDNLTGTMDGDKVIDLYYTYSYKVVVRYINIYTGREMKDSYSYRAESGTSYDVTDKIFKEWNVPGFSTVYYLMKQEGDAAVGTLDGPKKITLYYGYYHDITINYLNYNNNQPLLDSITLSAEHNSEYNVTAHKFNTLTASNTQYVLKKTSGDELTGTMDGDKVINLYYVQSVNLAIEYLDKYTGEKIHEDYTLTAEYLSGYNANAQRLDSIEYNGLSYSLDSAEGDDFSGILNGNKSITLYYGYNNTVTVNYLDKYTGEAIADSIVLPFEHNSEYNVSDKKLEAIDFGGKSYYFVSADGDSLASYRITEDKVINLYYGYDNTITIKYIDYYTGEDITASVTLSQEHNSEYDVTDRKLSSISANSRTYNLYEADSASDAELTGTLSGDKHINFYYVYDFRIVIKYLSLYTGEEMRDSYSYTAQNGTLYDVTGSVYASTENLYYPDGYEYVLMKHEGDPASGILDGPKLITLYYGYYEDVTVNYLDKYTGEKISESVTESIGHTEAYDVTDKQLSSISANGKNYYFTSADGDELTGTMDGGDKVINLYYGYDETVTVNYLDKYTGEAIANSSVVTMEHQSEYDVQDKKLNIIKKDGITYYFSVSDGAALTGTLDCDKVINLYYSYDNSITVNYLDKYTNIVIAECFIGEQEHNSEYDVTDKKLEAIDFGGKSYYFASADGDELTGALDCDKVINLYYAYDENITVNYLDKYTGEQIAESFTLSQEHGTSYDITVQKLPEIVFGGRTYKFDSVSGDDFIGVFDSNKSITLYYGYGQTVTVNYLDKFTGEFIHDSYITSGEHNSVYDVQDKHLASISLGDIFYYYSETDGADMIGTLDCDKVINIYYTYDHSIVLNFLDKYTNEPISGSITTFAEHNIYYDVQDKKAPEFAFEDVTYIYGYSEGNELTGTLDCDKVINLYYGYYNTITVDYVDKYTGETIKDGFTATLEHNTPYDYSSMLIDRIDYNNIDYNYGYVLGAELEGILERNLEVKICYGYYHKVHIDYLDKYTSRPIHESFDAVLEHGETYNVNAEKISGIVFEDREYKFALAEGDDFIGILDGDKDIDVYYGYGQVITVNYLDKFTGEAVSESYISSGEHNSEYDVTDKKLTEVKYKDFTYRFDSVDSAELTGLLDCDKVINLYFTYDNTITVYYKEFNTGRTLIDPVSYTGEHLTSYDVTKNSQLELTGYKLNRVTGDAITGTFDSDKAVIVWYDKKREIIPVTGDNSDNLMLAAQKPATLSLIFASVIAAGFALVVLKRKESEVKDK